MITARDYLGWGVEVEPLTTALGHNMSEKNKYSCRPM